MKKKILKKSLLVSLGIIPAITIAALSACSPNSDTKKWTENNQTSTQLNPQPQDTKETNQKTSLENTQQNPNKSNEPTKEDKTKEPTQTQPEPNDNQPISNTKLEDSKLLDPKQDEPPEPQPTPNKVDENKTDEETKTQDSNSSNTNEPVKLDSSSSTAPTNNQVKEQPTKPQEETTTNDKSSSTQEESSKTVEDKETTTNQLNDSNNNDDNKQRQENKDVNQSLTTTQPTNNNAPVEENKQPQESTKKEEKQIVEEKQEDKDASNRPQEDKKEELSLNQRLIELNNSINEYVNSLTQDNYSEYHRDEVLKLYESNSKLLDDNNMNEDSYNNANNKFNELKLNPMLNNNYSYYEDDVVPDINDLSSDSISNIELNKQTNLESHRFISQLNIESIPRYQGHSFSEENRREVEEFTRKLIADHTQGKDIPTLDKARVIFNWIHKNVRYAWPNVGMPEIEPHMVLRNKLAVCGGYSNLYKVMLDTIGIKNAIVIGPSKYGAHQWNLVYDDQSQTWFHSDPTWGGNAYDSKSYFKRTLDHFSEDHKTQRIMDLEVNVDGVVYEYWNGFAVKSAQKGSQPKSEVQGIQVTAISNSYFQNNSSIYVPQYVKYIDFQSGTGDIRAYSVDENNPYFSSFEGVLFSKNKTKIISYPRNKNESTFTIPKETMSLYDEKQMFNSNALKHINVESGSKWFNSYKGVLYDNTLENVIFIPDNLNKVYIRGSANVRSELFAFKDNINTIVFEEGISQFTNRTFNSMSNLRNIYIPTTLNTIRNDNFINTNLDAITLYLKQANKVVQEFANNNKMSVVISK